MRAGFDSKDQLYDPIRRLWTAATPEERVRQKLLREMVGEGGYPPSCLAVEVELSSLPHLRQTGGRPPKRRIDLICYAPGIHPDFELYPLLVVECKAATLTPSMFRQLTGYHHFLESCFIALVNETQRRTAWYDAQERAYRFVDRLPSYADLMGALGCPHALLP